MLSKIYTYSAKTAVKAIYIDIAVLSRLDEFYNLLGILNQIKEIIQDIFEGDVVKGLKSQRLKALVSFSKARGQATARKSTAQKRKRSNSRASDKGTS